jgi:hypothetical protein
MVNIFGGMNVDFVSLPGSDIVISLDRKHAHIKLAWYKTR